MQKLKIVFVGNFDDSWATEEHIAREFEAMGHTVDRIRGNIFDVNAILDRACRGDLFMYSPKWSLKKAGDRDGLWLLARLRKRGITSASHHLDVHIGLDGRDEKVNVKNPFWAFDYVFTADGGSQEEFSKRGINHVHLSPGVPASECQAGRMQDKYKADIIFVGTCSERYYHRQWPFRKRLLDWLKGTYGDRFQTWGPGSANAQHVRNGDLNDLYASAKIVIGDSMIVRGPDGKPGNYWSNRCFEAVGRGGFLIFPYARGLERFLTAGKHYVAYDHRFGELTDFGPLREMIDFYLENESEREAIRSAGHEHVARHHTFIHRMQWMLNLLTENGCFARPEKEPRRLCVGSGMAPELGPGWTNMDVVDFGNNIVHDLEKSPWPFADNTFAEIKAVDILEHLDNIVPAVNEVIRIARPGARIFVQVPNAKYPDYVWTDPEHKRGFAERSFDYWQPDKGLCRHFGRSKHKDKFFIRNLKVRELNLNLVFEFEKAWGKNVVYKRE